jgi:hypothetical protein
LKGSGLTTVIERLAESWLDSQTERRYQPAFIQLLISEGWKVLHNTRHSPIEFGKDVLARSSMGELYAFQLKGNPGSRLTKSQAQEIAPQILELIETPVSALHRTTSEQHVAVLVTNGEVDEEAQLLLRELAERTKNPLSSASRFELWSRGNLLGRLVPKAAAIWPSSLEGTRKLLQLYAATGFEIPDPVEIGEVLTLAIGRPSGSMSSAERTSKLTSLLLLGEILKAPWYGTRNHYSLFHISVLVTVFAMRFADSGPRKRILAAYAPVIADHCVDLMEEAKERKFDAIHVWPGEDPFSEIDIMVERIRLTADCAAALVLGRSDPRSYSVEYVRDLLSGSFGPGILWGQAAVPAAITRYWAHRRLDASQRPDSILGSLLSGLIAAANGRATGVDGLPDPYHGFEACWARLADKNPDIDPSLLLDTFKGHTWFATPLLFMLAKRNWKQSCKSIWYQYSKVTHDSVSLEGQEFFDALLSKKGTNTSRIHRDAEWHDFVVAAVNAGECRFLNGLEEFAWVIAAYIGIVPYRAWTGVLMWLDSQLCDTWYSAHHLPPSNR